MIRWPVLLLVPVLLSAAGCRGDSGPGGEPPSSTSMAAPSASGAPSSGPELGSASTARPGVDYRVLYTKAWKARKEPSFGVLALSPEGSALVTIVQPRSGTGIPPTSLALLNSAGKLRVRIPRLAPSGPPQQVAGGAITLNGVVWKETSSTDLFQDQWSIYSYDFHSQRTRLLAEQHAASGAKGAPSAPGGTVPSVGSDGRVYYSAVDTRSQHLAVHIYSVSTTGSDVVRDEGTGLAAQASGRFLFWMASTGNAITVQRRTLSTNETRTVVSIPKRVCPRMSGMTGTSGGWAAVGLRCRSHDEIRIYRGSTSMPVVIRGQSLGYLKATEEFVGFAAARPDNYIQYLYRQDSGQLLKIGHGYASGELATGGTAFSWTAFVGSPRTPKATATVAQLLASEPPVISPRPARQ